MMPYRTYYMYYNMPYFLHGLIITKNKTIRKYTPK